MPLGNTYSSSGYGAKKDYAPTVYANYYRLSNPDSKIDPTTVNYEYWKGMLKISIAPKKPTTDGSIAYDSDKSIAIYLTIPKAIIFKQEIEKFLAEPGKWHNCGVSTNKGCIYVSDGKEFNSDAMCLVINVIDQETGRTASTIAYEFHNNYHFGIRNYREEDNKGAFDKMYDEYNNLEVYTLLRVLNTYLDAFTQANGAAVQDTMYYRLDKMNNNIYAIAEKLGVDVGRKSNNANYSNKSSFFNNNGNVISSKPSTQAYSDYEDIDLD